MKRLVTLFALLTLFAIGAKAQMVGANEGQKVSTNNTSSFYKPTGHYLRFEAGFPHASAAYGYQLNHYLMLGAGTGFGELSFNTYDNSGFFYRRTGSNGIPLFVEAIFSTPKYKWSFVADIKFGYSIPIYDLDNSHHIAEYYNGTTYHYPYYVSNRIFGEINIGVAYKYFSLCAGISSNNTSWFSFFISYNLPLKVNK